MGKPAFWFISDYKGELTKNSRELRYSLPLGRREQIFKMCDSDKSKGCTIDELGSMIVREFQMIFDLVDINGDGLVSYNDFVCDINGSGGCDAFEVETIG